MTVALVLAAEADAGLRGQLAALGVRRVDAADRTGPGLLTVAAAARVAGERVLVCVGEGAAPEPVLARLLAAGRTAAFTGMNGGGSRAGALVVDTADLDALAGAAESLAASQAAPAAVGPLLGELARRGVTVRILDAGPDGEGAVAQLLVDPAASDVARWAAWRGLTASALAGISLGLGLLAAVWFSELAVRAKVLAIAALSGSFLAGRAGALLAAGRAERRARPVAEWLGAAAGLLTEIAVYAALAVSSGIKAPAGHPAGLAGVFGGTLLDTVVAGWGGAGQAGVWRLAVAAMGVLAVRRMAALCYGYPARTPGNLSRRPVLRALEQSATLPAGDRFVVIAVTSVFFGPRLTFGVLLCWGVLAVAYLLAAQISGTARPAGLFGSAGELAACRGDGVVSRWFGGLVQGRLPPLLPVPVGLLVTCVLAALGLANLPGILVLTPVEAMLLAALGACHPHDGRLDWLAPPLLQAGEYVFLAALGFAYRVPAPVVFALLAAVVVRHADLGYRARVGRPIPADVHGLGWDGRMLVAGVAAVIGIVPFAYAVLSGYLWLLFFWDFLGGWLAARDGDIA
jgi:Family of unknown function (DUF5941)